MVAPTTPAKKLSNGRDTWWLVPTVTASAPTVAQVNTTTGGLNVTGMLLSDYEGATTSTEKVTLPKVLLETATTEVQGETTTSLGDMQITFQPQAAAGSDGKKAWELFTGGVFVGYAVRRQDMLGTTGDAAAGQFVDVFPISAVRNAPTKTTTGPDGIYIFTASIGVTGSPTYNVAVAA